MDLFHLCYPSAPQLSKKKINFWTLISQQPEELERYSHFWGKDLVLLTDEKAWVRAKIGRLDMLMFLVNSVIPDVIYKLKLYYYLRCIIIDWWQFMMHSLLMFQ